MGPLPPRSTTARHHGLAIVLCLVAIVVAFGRNPLDDAAAQVPDASRPAAAAEPVEPSIAGPRNLLRRHGVTDARFDSLHDGGPLDDDETETLLTVTFWIRSFRTLDLQRWSQGRANPARLADDPHANRGEVFLLSGRVARVELRHPSPAAAERFELPQYYRCELVLDEPRQPVVVFVENVPRQWQDGGAIDQRATALGLFLKLADDDPDRPIPVFVARHVAWYPPTLLGNLDMDVGLLDDVVDLTALGRSRRADDPVETARAAGEREAFYAMLDAVGRATPGRLQSEAAELLQYADHNEKRTDLQGNDQFSVVPLFLEPQQHRGRLVMLTGHARRVVRIPVDDPDIVARFGIDHYYEISLFTDDSQGNPIIFCVRELPEGMPTGDGPEYGERLSVAGFLFKLWSYHGSSSGGQPQADDGRGPRRQWAPLLIGRRPVWYPYRPPKQNPTAGAIAGGLFVLVVLCTWLVLWRSSRADKRFHDRTVARSHALAPDVSLDKIGLDAQHDPNSDEQEKTDPLS